MKKKLLLLAIVLIFAAVLVFTGILDVPSSTEHVSQPSTSQLNLITEEGDYVAEGTELNVIPQWDGQPWVELNGNMPQFTDEEKKSTEAFEIYSDLDSLGRCGVAYANVCDELMPTAPRESISSVHPSGWVQAYYPQLIANENLYSRAHLIAFQLAGENANEKNLITGTMYLNMTGMLDFEEQAGDYARATGNHVLYRVTPVFTGSNLVADGVQMEAWSVEDNGKGVCYNVFCYNVQPGVSIDYATGESTEDEDFLAELQDGVEGPMDYVLNTGSMKFHLPDCPGLGDVKNSNKKDFFGYRSILILQGYAPCKSCNP